MESQDSAEIAGLEIPTESELEPIVLQSTGVLTGRPAQIVTGNPVGDSHWQVATQSIFGRADPENWRPLPIWNFFEEGWNEPFVNVPRSTTAPRQAWINALDGVTYRQWISTYAFRWNVGGHGDYFYTSWNAFLPLNRRLNLVLNLPIVRNTKGGPNDSYISQFGDMNIMGRVLLHESTDLSIVGIMGISLPTGQPETGGGSTVLKSGVEFWRALGDRWVMRGGLQWNVPVGDSPAGIRTTGQARFALGKHLTEPGKPLVGDMVVYTAAELTTSLDDRGSNETLFCLTPGYRAQLFRKWYHLGAIEVPMFGGASGYDFGLQLWILKEF